jgi:hypothetical protein
MKPLKDLGLRLIRGSVKCSRRNEAPKRQGAKQKFGNINEIVLEGMNIQTAKGTGKIDEINKVLSQNASESITKHTSAHTHSPKYNE